MTKPTLIATLFTVLIAACATTPDPDTHDDGTGGKGDDGGETADLDLGLLPKPCQALANQTFELARGQTLKFQSDVNQIFGVFGVADGDSAATGLTFDDVIVQDMSGGAGSTTRYELHITAAADAKSVAHDLVTETPYQTRNDPDYACHFVVQVTSNAAY